MAAFLDPIERAVACLGTAKIVVSPQGRRDTSKVHSWSLNGGAGLALRGSRVAGCRFLASMHYRIIPTDPDKYDVAEVGAWRVTTAAYFYEFRNRANEKIWALHWHPEGTSPARYPHQHLYTVNKDGHFVTPRHTLESAVQWCIQMGARSTRSDWDKVLAESDGIHRLYSSWR